MEWIRADCGGAAKLIASDVMNWSAVLNQFTQEQISATYMVELISSQQLTTQLEVPPMKEDELASFIHVFRSMRAARTGQQGLGWKSTVC